MGDPSLQQSKNAFRAAAFARRDALTAEERAAAREALAHHAPRFEIAPGAVVAGYAPLGSEIDPGPLMAALAARGARLALPVVTGRGVPLKFRAFRPGDALARGAHGIREPLPEAPLLHPSVVLVPLAAFDRAGHRIGYGAGYYDRTLEILRRAGPVTAIGLAFAVQEVPLVPAAAHDERLDLVLTERGIIDLRRS